MNDDPRSADRTEPDVELERRLEAYSDARLRPDPARAARLRVELLLAARARSEATPSAPGLSVVAGDRAAGRRRRWVPALLAAAFATAVLAGTVAAGSGPGGPLYGARLWLEQATLPSEQDARLDVQLRHLQERLDEASKAANEGNGPAVQAALDAYRQEVQDALGTAGSDLSSAERLSLILGRHLAVLQALAAGLPEQATDAIQRAIDRTEQKIDQVQSATPKPNPGGPNATPGGPAKTPPGKPTGAPGKPTAAPGKTPPGHGGPTATPPGGPDKTPPGKPAKTPRP